MRIVSLLPSATEMICMLGLEDQLVGITHECDFPHSIADRAIVTRSMIPAEATSAQIDAFVRERSSGKSALYQLDVVALEQLRPDLIVTQALCDVCAVDESEVSRAASEMAHRPTVLNLEPISLAGVFDAMTHVATAAGIIDCGASKIDQLKRRVATVRNHAVKIDHRPSVVFLEWLDPLFCAGHWNPELVELAGGRECIGRSGERSRRIEWDEVLHADPEILFVACCGYSIDRTLLDVEQLRHRPNWNKLRAVRDGCVFLTDGSAYFNRPGPRLVDSLEILSAAIHPDRTAANQACFAEHVPGIRIAI